VGGEWAYGSGMHRNTLELLAHGPVESVMGLCGHLRHSDMSRPSTQRWSEGGARRTKSEKQNLMDRSPTAWGQSRSRLVGPSHRAYQWSKQTKKGPGGIDRGEERTTEILVGVSPTATKIFNVGANPPAKKKGLVRKASASQVRMK